MLEFGKQIGAKFQEDGTPKQYPGNTVITDITPQNPAYQVMKAAVDQLKQDRLSDLFILLPEDSYHMTVMRGVNDQIRTPDFWPETLPADASMTQADDYLACCMRAVPPLGRLRMKFSHLHVDDFDLRICLNPETHEEERRLRVYRDDAAAQMNLRLPGHEEYTFHITLAYTLHLPQQSQRDALEAYRLKLDRLLKDQPAFVLDEPYVAFYNDMIHFSAERLARA